MPETNVLFVRPASEYPDFISKLRHGGVREIICGIAHYVGLKGWKVRNPENPKVISSVECEIEVYHPAGEKQFAYKINAKAVEDPTLETLCKEYYCVELSDLHDKAGVNKTIFHTWTFGTMIHNVDQLFPSLPLPKVKKGRKSSLKA